MTKARDLRALYGFESSPSSAMLLDLTRCSAVFQDVDKVKAEECGLVVEIEEFEAKTSHSYDVRNAEGSFIHMARLERFRAF